jgi:hypothetical protein
MIYIKTYEDFKDPFGEKGLSVEKDIAFHITHLKSVTKELKEVEDTPIGFPIGNGGFGTPNWGGTITYPSTTPYSIPLTGTITTGGTLTTSSYPSGSTLTYTTGNGGVSTYTMGGTITSTTSAYVNQSSEEDEKLLLD